MTTKTRSPYQPWVMQAWRRDAATLRRIAREIRELQSAHPAYHTLQNVDTNDLTIVAGWLEDDADQHDAINAEGGR